MATTSDRQVQVLWALVVVLTCVAGTFLFMRDRLPLHALLRTAPQQQAQPVHLQPAASDIDVVTGLPRDVKAPAQPAERQQQADAGGGFEPAAPWAAPQGTTLPYQNLQSQLDELLKVQANPHNWVSILTMTAAIKRFTLNCVYTMRKYGDWPHFIIATFDADSLNTCIAHNLPCLDASSFATQPVADGQHSYGSSNAIQLWWAKQRLALAILTKGYNVHGSDSDVVYFKSIGASYDGVFQNTNADAIFAREEWKQKGWDFSNFINAGVYAVRSNKRTISFFQQWTAQGEGVDQHRLNELNHRAYEFCDSYLTCTAVTRRTGKMTIFRHPTFYPGGNGHCICNSLAPAPCDSRRLYLHQICGDNRWNTKSYRWDNLTLWFIDDTPQMRPLYADGGGPKGPHPFMPCADKVAWVDLEYQVKENPA